MRCLLTFLTSVLATVSFALLCDTCWFPICRSTSSSPAKEMCKATNSIFTVGGGGIIITNPADSAEGIQSRNQRTHRGTQMGLSVNSRDSTPAGELLRGNVLVRCRARRMSLIAASTESLLVCGGSRLILRCG